jgi:hypothetical protein
LRVFVSLRDGGGNVSSSLPLALPYTGSSKGTGAAGKEAVPVQSVAVLIPHTAASPLENAGVWQKIPAIGPIARGLEVVGEQSMHLKVLWDEQALYLRVQVDDPSPWRAPPDGVPWWNGDSLHLRLRTDAAATQSNVPEQQQKIVHVAWYPSVQGEGTSVFVVRGRNLTEPVGDAGPVTTSLSRSSPHNYELTARLPWKFLDSSLEPGANRSIRFALLAAYGDVLLPEVAGGASLNEAQQLFNPDAWGMAALLGRDQ